jgi:hypothetical protein
VQEDACGCGLEHPVGMPTLGELCEEIGRALGQLGLSADWVGWSPRELALELHDLWVACGFRDNHGRRIHNWRAGVRGWLRWKAD